MLFKTVDRFMSIQNERIFSAVPSASSLVNESMPFNKAYYIRHRVETVKRIWMTSQIDALALAAMIDEDYDCARLWSKYLTQELSHDLLYLKDLEKHGYSVQKVASIPAFSSTIAMVSYLKDAIARYGSIVAVTYSVWVEWNSDKASALVVKRAQKAFSQNHIKGSYAHTRIDINEDHYAIMLKIIEKLILRGVDEKIFYHILSTLTDFFIGYFQEIADETLLFADL
jgi:hypothetical protein